MSFLVKNWRCSLYYIPSRSQSSLGDCSGILFDSIVWCFSPRKLYLLVLLFGGTRIDLCAEELGWTSLLRAVLRCVRGRAVCWVSGPRALPRPSRGALSSWRQRWRCLGREGASQSSFGVDLATENHAHKPDTEFWLLFALFSCFPIWEKLLSNEEFRDVCVLWLF